MNIEKWIIAHFSPTGGTKKIDNAIAAGFQIPAVELDLTKADSAVTLGENDALMAVLPVYAGRVPQISLERLTALKGHGQKAVAVVVYGNREYEDALLETRDALEANGFRVIAAAAFIAEHSIVRSIASHTNNDLCINCMRCVQVCPVSSRALPDAFLTMITQMLNEHAAGYKRPVVFL